MATSKRRTEWHQVKGKWTRSLGERGLRVRLFQKRREGPFYRAVWVPGRGRNQAPLGTSDRQEAERLGRLLLAELLHREGLQIGGPLTLETLWTRFAGESPAFLDNAPRTLALTVPPLSAALSVQSVEAARSTEYQDMLDALGRELRYKAWRKGASAVLNFSVQLDLLTLPSRYRMLVTGSAVRAAQAPGPRS